MGFGSIYWRPKRKKKKVKFSKAAKLRRQLPYREYLKTPYWQKVRVAALKKYKKCKRCLCRGCHKVEHFGQPVKIRRPR